MIGLAGCGCMGQPMLRALRDGGSGAIGFDIVEKDPAWITNDAQHFASTLETLFVVVPDEAQVRELLFDGQKLVQRSANLSRIVLCSTISPRAIPDLTARLPNHIALIDAPMAGSERSAQNRNLTFMLGGTNADIDELTPLLVSMGDVIHRMGPLGAGMTAKAISNLVIASNTAVTRFVFDWADSSGLDRQKLSSLINETSGQDRFTSNFRADASLKDGDGCVHTIDALVKDLAAAIDAAPKGADLALAQTIMNCLQNRKPRD